MVFAKDCEYAILPNHPPPKSTTYNQALWLPLLQNLFLLAPTVVSTIIGSRGRRVVTIWEDSEDDSLPQHLAKPSDIAY